MLPLKAGILDYAIDHQGETFTIKDIIQGLEALYKNEKQLNEKRVGEYCADFLQNNFFEKVNVEITNKGDVIMTYKVTDYAVERGNRFIPSRRKA